MAWAVELPFSGGGVVGQHRMGEVSTWSGITGRESGRPKAGALGTDQERAGESLVMEFLWRRWHRLMWRPLPEPSELRPVSLREGDPLVRSLLATRPTLERILTDNIVPFWHPRCLDQEHGGYRVNHDSQGRWKGPASKFAVPQARTCWFFSRLARTARLPEALAVARHGFEFLQGHFWDPEEGGFFWQVTEDGTSPVDAGKLLYGQTFGLYGAAEYGRASGDPDAIALAAAALEVIEQRFHDPLNGGYFSEFTRSWTRLDPEHPRSGRSRLKTLNDHVHALEAFTTYLQVASGDRTHSRLRELILLLTGTMLRKTSGACTDLHRTDWTPLVPRGTSVSYGHDTEAAWLVCEACSVAGVPIPLVLDFCRTVLDNTMRWGWDRRGGGVYFAGPIAGPADDRRKVFWVQAEVLVSSLMIYRLTGDTRYADFYLATLEWITTRQVDWSHGEWHAVVEPNGTTTGDKAYLWKSAYHTGRAMLMSLELLDPEVAVPNVERPAQGG